MDDDDDNDDDNHETTTMPIVMSLTKVITKIYFPVQLTPGNWNCLLITQGSFL